MTDTNGNTRQDLQLTDTKLDHLINKVSELAVGIAKVDTKQCAMHQDVIEVKEKVKEQNGRIRILEGWRNYILGAIGVILAVLYFIAKAIT